MYLKDFKINPAIWMMKDLESALRVIAAKIRVWVGEWHAAPSACLAGGGGGASKRPGFSWARRSSP